MLNYNFDLIFPPLWSPFSISGALAYLKTSLNKNNIKCKSHDFNILFFREILSKNFLEKSYILIQNYIKDYNNRTDKQKYSYIYNYFQNNQRYIKYLIDNIEKKISVFNSKKDFYNPLKLIEANVFMTKALEFASLLYYPLLISNNYCFNEDLYEETSTLEKIIYFVKNPQLNIYNEFIEKNIYRIKSNIVGISVSSFSQFLFAMTIAKKLKEINSKNFIVIGGQYITSNINNIMNNKQLFNYVDLFMYGEGDEVLVNVIKKCMNKAKLYKLNNIIYLNKNAVITANTQKEEKAINLQEYSFEDFDFSKYFLPEIVLPIQTSGSCYWGNCVFCCYTKKNIFTQKSVNAIADEIYNSYKKYKINHYYFTDCCLDPNFLNMLADEIFKRNLKIYYYVPLRLESQFNKKLLKKLYKSGLRYTSTGFESFSQRILNKYNKGISTKNYKNYLKNVYDANISLAATFMVGFPDETENELKSTVNFILENINYFDIINVNKVFIPVNSILYKNMGNFGIKENDIITVKDLHLCFLKQNNENKEISYLIKYLENLKSDTRLAMALSVEAELLFASKFGRHNLNIVCKIIDLYRALHKIIRGYRKKYVKI